MNLKAVYASESLVITWPSKAWSCPWQKQLLCPALPSRALCQDRLLISKDQLFLMCRVIKVWHCMGAETMFGQDGLMSLVCDQDPGQYRSSRDQGQCPAGTQPLVLALVEAQLFSHAGRSCIFWDKEHYHLKMHPKLTFKQETQEFHRFQWSCATTVKNLCWWLAQINAANSVNLNHKFLTSELWWGKSYQQLLLTLFWSLCTSIASTKHRPKKPHVSNQRIKVKQSSVEAKVKGKEGWKRSAVEKSGCN